jgi:hypothetical protein
VAQEVICKTQDNLVIGSSKFMPFKEGDKVWLEGTNLKLPYETPKLSPRQYRPFRVATKILDMAYQLELPEGWKIHSTFHASLLMPYKETEAHRPNFIEPLLELIEGKQEWEVEKVLGDWLYRKSQQYLVWWKGYSLAHDSWVKHSNLHTPDLISEYITSKCSRAKDNWTNSQRSA